VVAKTNKKMQAQNKYYPPDFDPANFRSINDYAKYHRNPKRGHGKPTGTSEDILEELRDERKPGTQLRTITVRFEMPFNIWCLGCNNHIGMGVRYNAEKFHIDNYHSTPVFKFRMKCHLCPSYIEIVTEPKTAEYVIIAGARQRIETFDPADAEVMVLSQEDEKQKLEQDVFYRLEKGMGDVKHAEKLAPKIDQIISYNESRWKDPYTHSQLMRRKFRKEKKVDIANKKESQSVADRFGLSLPILGADPQDLLAAQEIQFESVEKKISSSLKPSASGTVFKKSTGRKSNSSNAKGKLIQLVTKSRIGKGF
jgi:coiled-coil domain-containing protein 130